MAGKKIITVFGATGNQGGAVVKTFVTDPKLKDDWAVRAVTRNANSDAAKKLQSEGVEVVSADVNDKASLVKAMTGATAVFAVTNYWEKLDMQLEIQQGKNLVDAAKEAQVQQFIWSTLYNVKKNSNGALPHVYHFDSKAEVADYAQAQGVPTTRFMPGFYISNIPGQALRQQPADHGGAWVLAMPVPDDTPVPVFDTADTGKFVKAAVLHRDAALGMNLLGATGYMTLREMLEGFRRTFPEAGRTAAFVQVPHDAYKGALTGKGMPDFVAEELLENMRLMKEFGYYFGESLDATHRLVEDRLTGWEEYIKTSPVFRDLK